MHFIYGSKYACYVYPNVCVGSVCSSKLDGLESIRDDGAMSNAVPRIMIM